MAARADPVCRRRPENNPGHASRLWLRGWVHRALLAQVSLFWRPTEETERPVFPVAGGSATSTGGFGEGAASLGSLERGGDGECRMDLGDGGPDAGGVLPVALAEVFGCLCREFLGLAVVCWAIHRHSRCLVTGTGVIPAPAGSANH